MSFEFYRIVHLFCIMLIYLAFGALALSGLRGETRDSNPWHKRIAMLHGIGMLGLFVAGFGLLAKGEHGFPTWIWAKFLIFAVFGGAVAVYARKPQFSGMMTVILALLGLVAALLGVYQPKF